MLSFLEADILASAGLPQSSLVGKQALKMLSCEGKVIWKQDYGPGEPD